VSIRGVNIDLSADGADVGGGRARSVERSLASWLLAALVTFVVWRGSLYAFDLLGLSLTPTMGNCRKQWQVFGKSHPLLNGFFRWDSGWYLNIAGRGYSYRPESSSSVAFYPLLPYLSRYLGVVVGSVPVAGLLIANAATVGAIYYLRRLGNLLGGEAVGKLASILLLVFPTSLFLSSFYTEGLFVCLAAGSMYHYFRGRYLWCGLLGLLAMLTRSTGLVLFVALALDLGVRLYRRELKPSASMAALLLIPAGLALFMAMQLYQVGDAFAFSKTMKHWGRHAAWPWAGIVDAIVGTDFTFSVNFAKTQRFIDALFALTFLGIGAWMAARGERIALWVFVVLGMLLPLSTYALAGMNRYSLGLFPAFIFLAQVCQKHPGLERWLIYASTLFLAVYSLRFMQCGWVG
jgi:mannosyltransferase PIG-V